MLDISNDRSKLLLIRPVCLTYKRRKMTQVSVCKAVQSNVKLPYFSWKTVSTHILSTIGWGCESTQYLIKDIITYHYLVVCISRVSMPFINEWLIFNQSPLTCGLILVINIRYWFLNTSVRRLANSIFCFWQKVHPSHLWTELYFIVILFYPR